jgi:hypothetical protein
MALSKLILSTTLAIHLSVGQLPVSLPLNVQAYQKLPSNPLANQASWNSWVSAQAATVSPKVSSYTTCLLWALTGLVKGSDTQIPSDARNSCYNLRYKFARGSIPVSDTADNGLQRLISPNDGAGLSALMGDIGTAAVGVSNNYGQTTNALSTAFNLMNPSSTYNLYRLLFGQNFPSSFGSTAANPNAIYNLTDFNSTLKNAGFMLENELALNASSAVMRILQVATAADTAIINSLVTDIAKDVAALWPNINSSRAVVEAQVTNSLRSYGKDLTANIKSLQSRFNSLFSALNTGMVNQYTGVNTQVTALNAQVTQTNQSLMASEVALLPLLGQLTATLNTLASDTPSDAMALISQSIKDGAKNSADTTLGNLISAFVKTASNELSVANGTFQSQLTAAANGFTSGRNNMLTSFNMPAFNLSMKSFFNATNGSWVVIRR